MKLILEKLFEHQTLTKSEAYDILTRIANAEFNDAHIASFMTVFLMRNITVDELEGFREALMALCVKVDLHGVNTIDVCGTGGDGKNTFNVSTLTAFVLAGAGYKVSKHGNYGVSSVSGSSDVLNFLGYNFTTDNAILNRQLDAANICFLHAPLFHPSLRNVGPVRKQLKLKTFFNMLGPLVNPAQPKYQLAGVFNLELARLYKYVFQKMTDKRFAIVYSLDGFDEVSLTSDFILMMNETQATLTPEQLGAKRLKLIDLYGGETVLEAAQIFTTILDGKGTAAQNSVVTANAGIAIHCIHPEWTLQKCMEQAAESLTSGAAKSKLQKLLSI